MSLPPYQTEQDRPTERKLGAVLLAIVVCGVGVAPVGLAAPIGGLKLHDMSGIGMLIVVFWILLLGLAIYAVRTGSSKALCALWIVAALNLSGCAIELIGVNKALG